MRILIEDCEDSEGLICVRVRPVSFFGSAILSQSPDTQQGERSQQQQQPALTARHCAERMIRALRDRAQQMRGQR